MSIIQVFLTAGLVFIGIYMYRRLRTSLLDIILVFLFMFLGIFLVLFPGITTRLAAWFGVGRGVDLVFYLGFLFLLFIILKLYARIRKLEQVVTGKIREETIEEITKRP